MTLLITLLFIIIHSVISKVKALDAIPRSKFLSMAGGISVSYIFLHLIPEISLEVSKAAGELSWMPGNEQESAFLMTLVGLCLFYGLERKSKISNDHADVYPIKLAIFCLYNFIIASLLDVQAEQGTSSMILYGVAMSLHFVVVDHSLLQEHKEQFLKTGRWSLSGSALLGWTSSQSFKIPQSLLLMFMAVLAGGVFLIVFKEELPKERESHFGAFLSGVALYSFFILAS